MDRKAELEEKEGSKAEREENEERERGRLYRKIAPSCLSSENSEWQVFMRGRRK